MFVINSILQVKIPYSLKISQFVYLILENQQIKVL